MSEYTPSYVQRDLLGLDPHQAGAKLDAEKTRCGLVLGDFAHALQAVSEVGTFGARKYTERGWLEVPCGIARYTDALYRHLLADAAGETLDADSRLMHLSHACWNSLAILELTLRRSNSV